MKMMLTEKEWLKHYTEMQLLAKQEALRNRKIDTIVTIRVPMTKKEVTAYVGEPCKDREVGCPACDAWKEWRLNYRYVSVQINRAEMVALLLTGAI